jgi:Caspase domain
LTFQGHALLIGVGTYQHAPLMNVSLTVRDAEAVAKVLRDPHLCDYTAEQVTLRSDSAATRNGILTSLDRIAALTEDVTVVLFYSGHGMTGADGNYYLTTYDTKIENKRVIPGSGVSEQELLTKLRAIKAKRLLLIINACHSARSHWCSGQMRSLLPAHSFQRKPPQRCWRPVRDE